MKRERRCCITGFVAAVAAFFAFSTTSCGPVHKALQSGDPVGIYNFGVEMYEQGEWSKAITLFANVEPYFVGTFRDDSLLYFKARSQYKVGNYYGAAEELDGFRRRYGRSIFLEDAEGLYALCFYYIAPQSSRDHKSTQMAIINISEFMSRYPESEHFEQFNEMREELIARLHQKSFDNAYTYYKIGRYKSAIVAFKNAMKEYPDSRLREELSFYTVASAYELANNSVPQKKEDRFLSMMDSYYTFIAEFPESSYRKQVDAMLKRANTYLDKQKELREAAKEAEQEEMVLGEDVQVRGSRGPAVREL
ncbi:MAG: outer membrane protein assembly factor BamD [Rikenellaceae bacterium]